MLMLKIQAIHELREWRNLLMNWHFISALMVIMYHCNYIMANALIVIINLTEYKLYTLGFKHRCFCKLHYNLLKKWYRLVNIIFLSGINWSLAFAVILYRTIISSRPIRTRFTKLKCNITHKLLT